MECIITGCALTSYDDCGDPQWVAGDLHRSAEGTYIFIANVRKAGEQHIEPAWFKSPKPSYSRHITASNLLERRGVFIIDQRDARLNDAAFEYIGAKPMNSGDLANAMLRDGAGS